MASLDDYKSDSANNFAEYAKQAKQYQSEIDTLSSDVSEKKESAFTLSSELDGMKQEDDPKAYEEKKAESEKADTALGTAEGALNDKRIEYNEYQSDNPSYSVQMEQMEKEGKIAEAEELGSDIQSFDAETEQAGQSQEDTQISDTNVAQPKMNERLKPSDNFKDWNNMEESAKPNNGKLAELAEQAKQDPQIDNTSKTIENTKADDSLDGGDDFDR